MISVEGKGNARPVTLEVATPGEDTEYAPQPLKLVGGVPGVVATNPALYGATFATIGNSLHVPDFAIARLNYTQILAREANMTLTTKAIGGTRAGKIAQNTLAVGSPTAVTPRDKALVGATIGGNDRVLGKGADVIKSVTEATRTLLAGLTADAIYPVNTAQWALSAGWTPITDGAALGGKWAGTNTVGAYAEVSYSGAQGIDIVVLSHPDARGVATISEGATTLGTINTAGTSSEDPTPMIFRVRGRGAGNHTIRVSYTSGIIYLEGALVPSSVPRYAYVLREPEFDTARYSAPAGASKAIWAATKSVINEYPTVFAVEPDPEKWQPERMTFDGLHPNDEGARYLVEAVAPVLARIPYSKNLGNTTTAQDAYPAVTPAPAGPTPPSGGVAGSAF